MYQLASCYGPTLDHTRRGDGELRNWKAPEWDVYRWVWVRTECVLLYNDTALGDVHAR